MEMGLSPGAASDSSVAASCDTALWAVSDKFFAASTSCGRHNHMGEVSRCNKTHGHTFRTIPTSQGYANLARIHYHATHPVHMTDGLARACTWSVTRFR